MSYIIEPVSILTFVTDTSIKLPRFQRKATWDKGQNFELAISIFQDYPVGVVIVNKERNDSWLLDGRQRRYALIQMRENPITLYEWAKKYIGFKPNEDEDILATKYWEKVEKYLQTNDAANADASNNSDNSQDVNNYGGEEDIDEDSFDKDRQRQGLNTLLDLIKMVHQIKSGKSRWERVFDFTKYIPRMEYVARDTGHIIPSKLRKFILDMNAELVKGGEAITPQWVFKYYDGKFVIADGKDGKFKEEIEKSWESIKSSVEVIAKSEKIFTDARIGIIKLTNVSPLDAQNIFSRVNKGGTLLKAEELLSAKPFWNQIIETNDSVLRDHVKTMYKRIGVEIPNEIYRWDIPATLLNRLDDKGLLFDSYKEAADKNEISMEQVTLGFKLVSSIFQKGMSGKCVNDLEKNTAINWATDIDTLIADLGCICEMLLDDPFFKFFQSWKKPMANLLGSAIVLEFITIMYEDWKSMGSPRVVNTQLKRDAKILFDKLVYEYSSKKWRGSGDSKMAADIANWRNRLSPISENDWSDFISGACSGTINGETVSYKALAPILYYYYCLNQMSPTIGTDISFDIDHLIPQDKFKNNPMVDQSKKDCLCNLSLLPKKDNISKSNKALNEITDSWLKQQITIYTGVTDFEKYSDISNMPSLEELRAPMFIEAFKVKRISVLSN